MALLLSFAWLVVCLVVCGFAFGQWWQKRRMRRAAERAVWVRRYQALRDQEICRRLEQLPVSTESND